MPLYIKNYSEDISLADIAKEAFIGEREALRCFARTIGISPIEYLLKYRIYTAAEMLRNSEQPIAEICLQTGFNSPSYFSKVFCRMLGTTPREYRKNKVKQILKIKSFYWIINKYFRINLPHLQNNRMRYFFMIFLYID